MNNVNFPELPSYSARWCPVYMEPIPGSGEKITVFIAVRGVDGAVYVQPVMTSRIRKALSKNISRQMSGTIKICVMSAETHLHQNMDLQSWQPPLSGFSLGKHRDALGDDVEDIMWQAKQLCSFFAFDDLAYSSEAKGIVIQKNATKWKDEVKKEVRKVRQEYSDCFDQKVDLQGGHLMKTIGFMLGSYAANFSILGEKPSEKHLSNIQAKLWQLDQLRDMRSRIDAPGTLEMIVGIPQASNDDVNNFREEICLEASSRGIEAFMASNPHEAAERLIARAA